MNEWMVRALIKQNSELANCDKGLVKRRIKKKERKGKKKKENKRTKLSNICHWLNLRQRIHF